ncbi:MAG TPA: hypothetical protein VKV05_14595 [Terriglobales bacterium]|nr:hypothetical protein [Terriglobales bacterium]
MNRRWIPIAFWVALLCVLGLSYWFPRLQAAWPALLLLAVGAMVVNYLLRVLLGRPVRSCGNSRWLRLMVNAERKQPPGSS